MAEDNTQSDIDEWIDKLPAGGQWEAIRTISHEFEEIDGLEDIQEIVNEVIEEASDEDIQAAFYDESLEADHPQYDAAGNTELSIEPVENPAPESSFGFLDEVYQIEATNGFTSARVRFPVDLDQVKELELNPSSLRLFHWNTSEEQFELLPQSQFDFDQQAVVSEITSPGQYTIIGLSTNPWILATVNMLQQSSGLMAQTDLGRGVRDGICKVILCRQFGTGDVANSDISVEEVTEHAEEISERGEIGNMPAPPTPASMGDVCSRCLETDPRGVPEGELLDPRDRYDIDFEEDGLGYDLPPIPVFTLDSWLQNHPTIANAIIWHKNSSGAPYPYPKWSTQEKSALARVYNTIRSGNCPGLSETPSVNQFRPRNGYTAGNDDLFSIEFSKNTAWEYFIAYVAQTLAAEISDWVPWSLSRYSSSELEHLLNSKYMFEHYGSDRYVIARQHHTNISHGAATPGDPCRVFQFLESEGILASNPERTIVRMIGWCRQNLTHYYGGDYVDNLEAFWQYKGWPPVERILDGTSHQSQSGRDFGFEHWTAGCWGTTAFLHYVLRTANIPVERVEDGCHMLPHFPHEGLALSHADDPYNQLIVNSPSIPTKELLIDESAFKQWFKNVSSRTFCDNIGRQTSELAVEYLPRPLLKERCRDKNENNAPKNSHVFDTLKTHFTLQELRSRNLWKRLDAKIRSQGGCGNI